MLVLPEVHEGVHQVVDDLVKDEADSGLVHCFDLVLVLTHGELFKLLWILDDLVDGLLLLVLLDVWLVLEEAVRDQLVDVVVVPQVDPSLVQDVCLHVVWPLLWRDPHLGEAEAGHEAVLPQNLVLVDLVPSVEWLPERL